MLHLRFPSGRPNKIDETKELCPLQVLVLQGLYSGIFEKAHKGQGKWPTREEVDAWDL